MQVRGGEDVWALEDRHIAGCDMKVAKCKLLSAGQKWPTVND